MTYAVNLADLTNTEAGTDLGVVMLLGPVIDRTHLININTRRVDEISIAMVCDDDRSQAIIQLIRHRYRKHQLRFYHSVSGSGGWKRV